MMLLACGEALGKLVRIPACNIIAVVRFDDQVGQDLIPRPVNAAWNVP